MATTIEELEDERKKLWERITKLESDLSQREKVFDDYKQKADAEIREAKELAKNKITDNEASALSSAKIALEKKNEITQILTSIQDAKTKYSEFVETIKNLASTKSKIEKLSKIAITAHESIISNKSSSDTINQKLTNILKNAQEIEAEAKGKWTIAGQQAQNIANLDASASKDIASIKATKTYVNEKKSELDSLRERLVALLTDKESLLSNLINDSTNELSRLASEIQKLLPGATSIALASAFEERKKTVEKGKRFWIWLLILSSSLLVAFGVLSIMGYFKNSDNLLSSIPSRIIIVTGLILIEEFARRNYNIISRLAESYAYKEALSRSYLGYKKEMTDILMPSIDNNSTRTESVSVLVKTFLDKLGDEPGKSVFDKEKGVHPLIDKLANQNQGAEMEKLLSKLSEGSFLSKISWPIVAVIGLIVMGICIIIAIIYSLNPPN